MSGVGNFRKKPVVIQAAQLDRGDPDQWCEVIRWCSGRAIGEADGHERGVLAIDTLEGTMIAEPGDWIIRSADGDFFTCPANVFEAHYEPADGAV